MSVELKIVKVGGAHLESEEFLERLIQYINHIVATDGRVVLVHGGGKEIEDLHTAVGASFEKSLGLRVTSASSMKLVTMVLAGLVNKRLVSACARRSLCALGVSGIDADLMRSRFLNEKQLGRVGGPPTVNADRMISLLHEVDVLVVSPICTGPDGDPVNVNADIAAQAIAVALKAECLDFVTDVDGVRTEKGTARSLCVAEIESLMDSSVISGGMIPKLQASLAALDGGVLKVRVGSLESLQGGKATEVRV